MTHDELVAKVNELQSERDRLDAVVSQQSELVKRLGVAVDKIGELVAEHADELSNLQTKIRESQVGFRNEPLPQNFFLMRGGYA